MNSEGNNNKCPLADEIVSYMYDEIHGAERERFETHLAGCTECTDDFAAVSNSRFSVFEWQKEEFAHLPTPQIIIPYAPKKAVPEAGPVGIFAGIKAWASLAGFPVTAIAALLITVGLGFAAMQYFADGGQQVAFNGNVPAVELPNGEPANGSSVNSKPVLHERPAVAVNTKLKDQSSDHDIHPVRVIAVRRNRLERQMTANNVIPVQDSAAKISKAPALSKFDEDDDKSLRLADLFDEDGG